MNKVTMLMATIAAAALKGIGFGHIPISNRSRTPNIPGSGSRGRTRAKAPADGGWHMKHHRGRV